MTRREYIILLRKLYLVANLSDANDNPARPDWLTGDECAEHCQAYDRIAAHMNLSENWLET